LVTERRHNSVSHHSSAPATLLGIIPSGGAAHRPSLRSIIAPVACEPQSVMAYGSVVQYKPSPKRKLAGQVRIGLSAGGRWIRTIGTPIKEATFLDGPVRSPATLGRRSAATHASGPLISSPAIIFPRKLGSASRPRLRRLRAKILAPRCIYPCQCSCSAGSAGRRWRGPGVFRPRAMMRRI
jgi:hypothetical protein